MLHKRPTLIILALLFSIISIAQTTDIEAVNRYWQLTDSLRNGLPVTDNQWNAFIELEGNKTYAASEFTTAWLGWYRRAIEIAYLPKNDSLLQKQIKAQNWYVTLAKRYKDEEQSLRHYLEDTVLKPAYFEKAWQYVYEYLPATARHPLSHIKLYYNCLSNDAVSYPNGLFFSLLSLADNRQVKAGTLEAHELHHRMRPAMNLGNEHSKAKMIAATDTGLVWALMSIPNEGIADLIDKQPAYDLPGDPRGIGEWLITPAPQAIRALDSVLWAMSEDKTSQPSKQFFRDLLQGTVGHMPGFFMARIIVSQGYKEKLIRTSANPFAFFELYQRAAKKDPAHPPLFSPTAMRYLRQLEHRYTSPDMIRGD